MSPRHETANPQSADPASLTPQHLHDALVVWRAVLILTLLCAAGLWVSTAHLIVATPPEPGDVVWHMNINTVDAPALELLPGVGPVLARRIVEDRTHAPFRSVGDLPRVKGIAEYTASRIAKHVVFGPSP